MPDRILVYGVTGSGKTAFAERISAHTGIPWHSVDDLTWEPGWVPVPDDEQRRRIATICVGEQWVLDAAYGKWLALQVLPSQAPPDSHLGDRPTRSRSRAPDLAATSRELARQTADYAAPRVRTGRQRQL